MEAWHWGADTSLLPPLFHLWGQMCHPLFLHHQVRPEADVSDPKCGEHPVPAVPHHRRQVRPLACGTALLTGLGRAGFLLHSQGVGCSTLLLLALSITMTDKNGASISSSTLPDSIRGWMGVHWRRFLGF